MYISLFTISCLFAFPKPESEVSRSFQSHFPDSNLISNFVFKMQKKGPWMYKNNQGQIEARSVSKGMDGKEGHVSLPSDTPSAGSMDQGQWEGGLAPLAGKRNRENIVSLL